jgi:hypothetical protein
MMKRIGILLLAMAIVPLPAQQAGIDGPRLVTLRSMRDHYRPVLVFSPSPTASFIQQTHILVNGRHEARERKIVLVLLPIKEEDGSWTQGIDDPGELKVGLMSAAEQTAARRRFHIRPNDFTVILIGKDGGEKLRSHQPISLDTLRSTIDAMPMRQEEMKSQPKR